ncbi:M14 metallopeptidase family protein [Flavobacterium sp. RHBU_24]|uniref:M14 family metallopeptidase n=1 Tax=Flavobacterium sp. RHBU_24 TaxID=3391185 RepID=UPI0039849411
MDLPYLHSIYKDQTLFGRYITNENIEPLLDKLSNIFAIDVIGNSVEGLPVYSILAGVGRIKIFIWSQMHGNESTTTKAIFDFLNFLASEDDVAKDFKRNFTFYILPIVNPDGARLYTRENANNVDLNRDSVALSQPESKLLRQAFENFKPDYCYNMHDQRTIFGVGDEPKPATVSFLAPSYNEQREINSVRQKAIDVIVAMNKTLQYYIPGQVGRFDDSFNINCIGDMFQSLNVPTVLFEAGHYQNDYEREETRKFIFFALYSGFNMISENVLVGGEIEEYFNIPQNKIIFYDMMYKKVKIYYENKEKITNFAAQYKEVVFDKSVIFRAFIREIGNSEVCFGHVEFDCNEEEFADINGGHLPVNGVEANFYIGKSRKFSNGTEVFM